MSDPDAPRANGAGSPADDVRAAERTDPDPPHPPHPPRPMVERIGLAAIALLFVVMFGAAAVAAWTYGEPFLAAMAATGCLMTAWVGALSLVRG